MVEPCCARSRVRGRPAGHLRAVAGPALHLSAEARDLDASYRKA
ncbi:MULTISPECIES: hypothetical protein [unclassified Streptomyces]|nr:MULTISPECIES: hypothetical protein [unclassified Streptomyces]